MRHLKQIVALWFGIVLLVGGMAWAAPQDQAKKISYTLAEFNAYQAIVAEKDPQNQIKSLDDFVQKYPSAELRDLLPFVYKAYYADYNNLKNYTQAFVYVDKMLGLGEQINAYDRLAALAARATPYVQASADKTLETPDAYAKARDAAAQGLQTLDQWQKPANTSDDAFKKAKQALGELFDTTAGIADTGLKDFKGAKTSFKAALAIDPDNAWTHYRLANDYLQDKPPQPLDGFWEMSRAIALKVSSTDAVKSYLRDQILTYQQLGCDKLVDAEVNSLIILASSSSDLPASLTIPSADDLEKVRADTANFIPWLQEGGDHGKVMWLATCGAEYPDVPVEVMEVTPGEGDNLTLKVYRPIAADADAQAKELGAATTPNMEVHVAGQPEAKRIHKNDEVRFTGTLTAYTQSPFLLTWDMAKINAADIPSDKATSGAPKRRTLPAEK
jgi:tetratricopeptide (TPR) repeat protein